MDDKHEIALETPGIPKDKITVNVGLDYIDISAELEKSEKKKRLRWK